MQESCNATAGVVAPLVMGAIGGAVSSILCQFIGGVAMYCGAKWQAAKNARRTHALALALALEQPSRPIRAAQQPYLPATILTPTRPDIDDLFRQADANIQALANDQPPDAQPTTPAHEAD